MAVTAARAETASRPPPKKARTAIVSLAIGPEWSEVAAATFPYMEYYAKKTGSDFIPITRRAYPEKPPHFEKFQARAPLQSHERIIFVDADVVVLPSTPDLFQVVPETHIGAKNQLGLDPGMLRKAVEEYLRNMKSAAKFPGYYFNTGVMVLSRAHAPLLDPEIFQYKSGSNHNYYEQTVLNAQAARLGMPLFDIGAAFNKFREPCKGLPQGNWHIYHYAGIPKAQILKDFSDGLIPPLPVS